MSLRTDSEPSCREEGRRQGPRAQGLTRTHGAQQTAVPATVTHSKGTQCNAGKGTRGQRSGPGEPRSGCQSSLPGESRRTRLGPPARSLVGCHQEAHLRLSTRAFTAAAGTPSSRHPPIPRLPEGKQVASWLAPPICQGMWGSLLQAEVPDPSQGPVGRQPCGEHTPSRCVPSRQRLPGKGKVKGKPPSLRAPWA